MLGVLLRYHRPWKLLLRVLLRLLMRLVCIRVWCRCRMSLVEKSEVGVQRRFQLCSGSKLTNHKSTSVEGMCVAWMFLSEKHFFGKNRQRGIRHEWSHTSTLTHIPGMLKKNKEL